MNQPPKKRSRTKPLPPEAVADMGTNSKPHLPLKIRLKQPLKWLVMALVIGIAVILFRHYHLEQYLQREQIQAWLEPLGPWTPVAFIGTCILTMMLVILPFAMMCAIAAVIFGTAWGTFWSVVGGTIAALSIFLLTRILGHQFVQKRLGSTRHWEALNQRLEKDGFYYIILVRAMMLLPFNLVNYVSAVTSIRTREFILATFIGMIPPAFIYNYGTNFLLNIGQSNNKMIVAIVVLILLIILPFIYRYYRKHRTRIQQRLAIQEAFREVSTDEKSID